MDGLPNRLHVSGPSGSDARSICANSKSENFFLDALRTYDRRLTLHVAREIPKS
jgi:hypothetical protein